jgi:hypothetical protein
LPGLFVALAANGLKERIQFGGEFVDNGKKPLDLVVPKQLALERSSQPMASFIKRATGYAYESSIILKTSASSALGNIGTNAVR